MYRYSTYVCPVINAQRTQHAPHMNNAKHTPGPWKVAISARKATLTRITTTDGALVASANGPGLSETGEAEANARLIAAAPELLAIVQRLSTMFPSGEGLGGYAPKEAFAAIGTQARAAIAKATGQG